MGDCRQNPEANLGRAGGIGSLVKQGCGRLRRDSGIESAENLEAASEGEKQSFSS